MFALVILGLFLGCLILIPLLILGFVLKLLIAL